MHYDIFDVVEDLLRAMERGIGGSFASLQK